MPTPRTPRRRAIRLVMISSIAVLAGFLGYWLINEWNKEKTALQKELSVLAFSTRSRLFDSTLVQHIIRPLGLSSASAMRNDSALSIVPVDSGRISFGLRQSQHPVSLQFRLRSDSAVAKELEKTPVTLPSGETLRAGGIRIDSFRQDRFVAKTLTAWTPGSDSLSQPNTISISEFHDSTLSRNDSMNVSLERSLKVFISTLADLPSGVERLLVKPDTAILRDSFEAALRTARIPLTTRWTTTEADQLLSEWQLGELRSGTHVLNVGGYRRILLAEIAPQIAFSTFLLCLTALAFLMTFRALRSQMQLAAMRNDLISNMSHELRTPVSTVKVALEAVSEPEVLANRKLSEEYLGMAQLELSRLEMLINQALQSALLEGGQLRPALRTLDFRALLSQLLHILQPRFQQAGGTVTMRTSGDDFSLDGDALQLQGVVINILDNALKYAGPGPTVEMMLETAPGALRLQISDRGPGIPAQYRKRIFDKFFRVPKGNDHSTKGYGLGLNYAAQVLRLHGAGISVGENPGGGCRFEITFPKNKA